MRDIKFRCWNMHSDTMHSWEEMAKGHKMHLITDQQGSYPIMQFTGLQDKNGVEIYEGDIVSRMQIDNSVHICVIKCVIKWSEQYAKFVFCSISDEFCGDCVGNPYKRKLYAVIGNIHENKELLEC